MTFDVVVPSVGRPSLSGLLDALDRSTGPRPERVILVDDRPDRSGPLLATPPPPGLRVEIVAGKAAGPASARNVGWHVSEAEWVAFLDDDVVPTGDWLERLAEDLVGVAEDVAASQGRIRVPLPEHRRPTDWERNVAGLATARWATADMAYRRSVLARVAGFDERFPRAFREDADLALRVLAAGYGLVEGRRACVHPVPPAGPWVSVRLQAGNADDALMGATHGRGWHERAGAPRGRVRRHMATTAAGVAGLAGLVTRNRELAALGWAGWLAGTAELAWARAAPGPRTRAEVATMVATSLAIPPAATFHRLRGEIRARWGGQGASHRSALSPRRPQAVLLDRDGTLVADVAYNGDPARVVPMPGAREALARLRAAGVPTALVSNQSGVGRGLITLDQVRAVNRRLEELVGPVGPWLVCPHDPAAGCQCRKPSPGLVRQAADALGVDVHRCALVGDVGADVEAARAVGARGLLVPTPATRAEEVAAAPEVAPDLVAAVDMLLGGNGR